MHHLTDRHALSQPVAHLQVEVIPADAFLPSGICMNEVATPSVGLVLTTGSLGSIQSVPIERSVRICLHEGWPKLAPDK